MLLLLAPLALAWPTASTTSASTTCSITGVDGAAHHVHGGAEASVGHARFTAKCSAPTVLTVEKVGFLTGHSCEVPPTKVSAEPKFGGILVDGMTESALLVTVPTPGPAQMTVSFTPVNAYYTWCDRFAFRVRFNAGEERLTVVSELNVMREEPLPEP